MAHVLDDVDACWVALSELHAISKAEIVDVQIAEAAEEVLRTEEAKKDKLCQELNLLVQQSAHAQLERLEQLTHRMENLNQGFVAGHSSPEAGASSLYERANPTEHSPNRSPMMEGMRPFRVAMLCNNILSCPKQQTIISDGTQDKAAAF